MFNLNSICSQLKMFKICIDIESFNHHSSGVCCVTVFYFQFQWYYLKVKMVQAQIIAFPVFPMLDVAIVSILASEMSPLSVGCIPLLLTCAT